MAIDYARLGDFNLDLFTGCIPDTTGAVMLEPNNYVPQQFLKTLDVDGAPVGWSKVEGPSSGGYHAYLFLLPPTTATGVRTGGKQTFTPDQNEQGSHLFNKPLVSGGLAPNASTPGVAIPAEPLEAPVVNVVATGVSGFPQGEYLAAISFVDKGGNHTMTTNPVQITINTSGRLIEFRLLLDADRTTVSGQGLWLSEPVAVGQTPDPAKLRLQDVAPNAGRVHVVKGPFNYSGRLAPTKNETEIGSPPKLERPRDFQVVAGNKNLEVGRYRFYQVQSTTLGDSLASEPSDEFERPALRQEGLQFHPQLAPQAVGYKIFWQDFYESTAPPFYQLVRTMSADRARYFDRTATPIFYGNKDSGEIAERDPGAYEGTWRNFTASTEFDRITLLEGSFPNNQEIRFRFAQNGTATLPAPLKAGLSYWTRDVVGKTFKVTRSKGGTPINLTTAGNGFKRVFTYEYVSPPGTYFTVSVAADPPTEDTSGIANPTGDIDVPQTVGLGIPQAGTYLVGYTRVLGGRETPISTMVQKVLSQADVDAGKVIKMDYPPRVNKIPNALYGQVEQSGLPLNWDFRDSTNAAITAPSATLHNFEAAGKFFMQATGSLTGATNRYPNAQTKVGQEIALDPQRIETIAGWLEVSGWVSGQGYAEVVQFSSVGPQVEVGSRLRLATLGANGGLEFKKTIAGAGLGADLELHADAQYAIIQWGMEAASPATTRQMRVLAHSLIWSPQDGVPRRYIAPASPTDPWTATTDPAAPFPSSHLLAIGPPPPTAASAAGDITAPPPVQQSDIIDAIDFENQAFPAGWTIVRNPVDANTEAAITTGGAIEGTYGFRVRDNSTSTANVYAHKTFPIATHGADVALRYLHRCDQTPSTSIIGGWIRNDMGRFYILTQVGSTLRLEYQSSGGATGTADISGITYANGTVLDVELKLIGLGTTTTRTELWIGVGDAERTLRHSRTDNYSSSTWTTPRAFLGSGGLFGYSIGSRTATQRFDNVYVTKTGYTGIVIPENVAPSLTPLVQPDWPWLAGTTLYGPVSSPVDQTITTSSRANLAVAATFNRSGAIAAERTLLQIKTSNDATELVGLYIKLTTHDVELRKGAVAYAAVAGMPTATDYRFDVIVTGAGTASGSAFVYRTIGTGARELIVMAQNLDFTGAYAQRVKVANNSELAETNITVTESGEYTYDNLAPDGTQVNQGYVAILPADVTNTDVGFVVDEFIVKPAIERTAAVFMRAEDLPEAAAPFTVVAYDSAGRSQELGSLYRDGTAVANASPGWSEYWMAYTPPDDHARIRIEHRGMTGGRYVFQRPLDAPGLLNSTALREAARDEGRAVSGTYFTVLSARVPGQSRTMVAQDYREERTDLIAEADAPGGEVGIVYTFTADAGTDVLTLSATHRYITDARVRVLTTEAGTLPAPLVADTTYYVRDATATTLKLSATAGGAAINITDAGTGTHSLYGYTSVASRWRSAGSEAALENAAWQSDTDDVPDLEWVGTEVTLEGDGLKTPVMMAGSPRVVYRPWMPMLLRADRTPLYGGVYIGGGGQENNLFRPYSRSMYDTETVGDRAAPRALTDEVGRLHGFTLNVFTPQALDEIYSNHFLDDEWMIVSPFHDLLMRVRFYEPPDEPSAMFDYEGFDEARPFVVSQMMPMVVAVERAEVIEVGVLSGEAPEGGPETWDVL